MGVFFLVWFFFVGLTFTVFIDTYKYFGKNKDITSAHPFRDEHFTKFRAVYDDIESIIDSHGAVGLFMLCSIGFLIYSLIWFIYLPLCIKLMNDIKAELDEQNG